MIIHFINININIYVKAKLFWSRLYLSPKLSKFSHSLSNKKINHLFQCKQVLRITDDLKDEIQMTYDDLEDEWMTHRVNRMDKWLMHRANKQIWFLGHVNNHVSCKGKQWKNNIILFFVYFQIPHSSTWTMKLRITFSSLIFH